MYGWRGRIGLIIPSSNTTMEEEFKKLLPYGISLHTARIPLRKATPKELIEMERYLGEASRRVADADVDIIVFGCTTGSLVKGYGYDQELTNEMTGETGIPSITTSTAVTMALQELRINRMCIATPYIEDLNIAEKKFFEDNGFEVVNIGGLGIIENIEIGKLYPSRAYELAKTVYRPGCEGVFISCTNFRTIEIIDSLEKDLGKPVISSNQVSIWATFKTLMIRDNIENYGSLFKLL